MSERRTIARHALTVLVGQLAVMAFGVTDTIVAGRFSEQALAALSVGAAVYITVFVALIGVLQALLPVWAELHGAQRQRELGRSVRQALYLAFIGTVAGALVLLFPGALLRWTEVPPALEATVSDYLSVLVLALPAALLFRMYSSLNQSLGKPQLVTWLQAFSLLVKIPLTIWFAFGGWGLPAQGAVGCAWATVIVNWLMLAMAAWLLRTQDLYRPYAIWRRPEPPDWRVIGEFARLGVPAGLAVMVEVTSFTLMALFIARQGTVASAAHQVASNLAAVLYMVPLSLAIATSARVSYWLGAGDVRKARHAVGAGFRLGLAMALLLAAGVALARWQLAAVYSPNPEVVAVAAGLLGWLALFHLGDAAQALCVFVLRCYRVTVAPLLAYCVLLWGVGLAGGYALAYQGLGPLAAQHSPRAFWMAGAGALVLLGPILAAILWRAVHRHRR
ncbi:MATE family efflux transporter [Ramlibacter solisilvae]|uniref:Multidrug-efflux transporter n=1 Tax=Ramlibacter tataouinensis TaxID=94132 RepID=A0A127JNR5_9BURK|nr:MATE family efflux transporter [Ramlibacter tataouinensis]AMO21637.1 multidrug transporter MatE [Ramlibacter tataouinensis]